MNPSRRAGANPIEGAERAGLYVHVNDSIRELASESPLTQRWEFICECSELGCRVPVSLTPTEFDALRAASPPIPVLAAGHAG